MYTALKHTGTAPATPEQASDADKKHKGWWRRSIYWTPENRAKVDPYLRKYRRMVGGTVVRVLRRFPAADYADLHSEGMYAVARCALKFDPAKGFQFTTYAMRAVYRAVHDRAVRGLKHDQLVEVPTVSLDKPSLTRFVGQKKSILENLADAETDESALTWLRDELAKLKPRDRLVLEMWNEQGMTYRAIGADPRVSLTRQRVQQVIDRVLESLAKAWRRRSWVD